MVTLKLKEEIGCKELSDKIIEAFERLCINENRVEVKKGFLKKKKEIKVPKYYYDVSKISDYVSGDSGPKRIDSKITLKLGYMFKQDKYWNKGRYLKIELENREKYGDLDFQCYFRDGTPVSQESKGYTESSFDSLVEKAITAIHSSLYGDFRPKEEGTGKVVY